MTALPKLAPSRMTIEEFLDWPGDGSGKKFELVDGEPRAMAPASAVAMPVFGAFRMLAAVELNNQAPLTTDKVDVVAIDRLLASEFEAAESATANARPQRQFGRRERAPQ